MGFISQFRFELTILIVLCIIRIPLNFKLNKNELKIKYYVVINVLIMLFALAVTMYMKKSIEFVLGMCAVFIMFDIYELIVKHKKY